MADITMCDDSECPKKATCFRALAWVTPGRQSYFAESPREGEECGYYWPCNSKSQLHRLDIQNED
jgi:hypothetical protein